MKELFDYIDTNPDCLVAPFLIILIASFCLGLWYESRMLEKDRDRSRNAVYFYMIAGCITLWVLSLYIGLLIMELWK